MQLSRHVFALAALPAVLANYCAFDACHAAATKSSASCSAFQRTTWTPPICSVTTTVQKLKTVQVYTTVTTTILSTTQPVATSLTTTTTTTDSITTSTVPIQIQSTSEVDQTASITTTTSSTTTVFTTLITTLADTAIPVDATPVDKRAAPSSCLIPYNSPKAVPAYAYGACKSPAAFASAASCMGYAPTTVTAPHCTTTNTVTKTSTTTTTATRTQTATLVVTSPTTTLTTVLSTATSLETDTTTSTSTIVSTITSIVATSVSTSVATTVTTTETIVGVVCPTDATQPFYLNQGSSDGSLLGVDKNEAVGSDEIFTTDDLSTYSLSNRSPTLWTLDPVTGYVSDTFGRSWAQTQTPKGSISIVSVEDAGTYAVTNAVYVVCQALNATQGCTLTCRCGAFTEFSYSSGGTGLLLGKPGFAAIEGFPVVSLVLVPPF